ncbi:hypothetical protein PCANC_24665 [Puccinia coronata f. sp. avenae]|uniref:DUF396-domain-containing protein n=1 Tax=Puccinia coronata f. sp. avenae TaxID=200324 RepID=A0A2N5TZA8_9BASI|nr:hypothetical protein PCASD_26426 [Puccinia coronata f. sp. avenae]PLW30846.1 hypothetical protein PCANC_24665 [Puccinia coronata f. sp. avenae]PLW51892.1 hypothetical protein PCASD_00796 [Puccinia coronata f. sp. avenae]
MLLLHLISFFVGLLAIAFVTLCLASGLLYLAEIIEENTQTAKRFGKQLIQVIIFLHLAFYLFDGLPLSLTILGILSHFVYLSNFSRAWPSISFTSLSFISSCCMVIIDHFAWFFYFADRVSHHHHRPSPQSWFFSTRNRLPDQLTFIDITTFFALCVWMVPFFLFLSLSASDNVLPNCIDLSLSQPMISTQSSALSTKEAQDLVYDASDPHLPGSIQLVAPRPPSMLKGMIQNCMKTIPRVGSNTGGRTSSRPNEGLLGSPNPHQSCPSSPAFNSSPLSPVVLLGSSPPASPASAFARRLSPCRNSNTTSPRRAFSSHYNDHLAFAPPTNLTSPRIVSSGASFPLPSSLSNNHTDDRRCTPNLPFDHILPSMSPTPHSFH